MTEPLRLGSDAAETCEVPAHQLELQRLGVLTAKRPLNLGGRVCGTHAGCGLCSAAQWAVAIAAGLLLW